jgi:sugar phosphate isomerase/epimerase
MTTARIRIGNQTCSHAPALDPFEFALRHKFDAFDWFSDKGSQGWCEAETDAEVRQKLRQAGASAGVRFSVHAPRAADPVSADGATAVRRSIDFAADVAAVLVNLHFVPAHEPRAFADALGPLFEAARRAEVRLSLENTPETSPAEVNALFAVLATMPEAADRVGLCFDMGHANLHAGTRNDYVGFLDRLGAHVPIIHWHAHENWGDRDSHLPLFTGPSARDPRGLTELARRLLRRGFRGSVVLEQWPNPPSLLVQARDGLRQILERNV